MQYVRMDVCWKTTTICILSEFGVTFSKDATGEQSQTPSAFCE